MAKKGKSGAANTLEQQTKSTEIRPPDKRSTVAFWTREFDAAKTRCKDWHTKANKVIDRYLDDRGDQQGGFRLNLFHANTATLESLMYANLPKVQVARRHLDPNDDVARVAATMLERILNKDMQENGKERDAVVRACLQDRLLSGLGCARVRYTFDTEKQQVQGPPDLMGMPTVVEIDKVVNERAPVDYWYWQDMLWGWGRSWADLPWIAFRSFLSYDEVATRFPGFEDKVEYQQQPAGDEKDTEEKDSPHNKAEIWEIWDRDGKCLYWYCASAPEMLDHKYDPLSLSGFFPAPPFLIANVTTKLYMPVPDYHLNQDLYAEIDVLESRINMITTACKVVGVYDNQSEGISRMLTESCENTLIPVDSWAMFAEKGGLRGTIDWFPIDQVSATLAQLKDMRNDKIGLLQHVTGMADVMSGQVNPYEGVGQSELKVAWGSVRVQALQNQFAQFFSNLLQLQAEVICSQFEPQTLLEMANAQYLLEEPQTIQAALDLLKSPQRNKLRIEVRAESVAQVDQARQWSVRSEYMNALATFMQSMAPMIESKPESMPYLLQMLQWAMTSLPGSDEIEGVLDKAIQESQKAAQNPKPDPAQQAAQMELQKIQAKAQADVQTRQNDLQADLAEIQATHQARLAEIMAQHEAKMKEIEASAESKMLLERLNLQANVAATERNAITETDKDLIRIAAESRAEEKAERSRTDD